MVAHLQLMEHVLETVSDLVAGSGTQFDSRGTRELGGLRELPLCSVVGESRWE